LRGARLVHRIHRGFQVEADIEGDLAHFIQGQQCLRELEQASYGELFDRRAIVQQREQVAMRRFQGIRDFNGQAQSSLGFKWSAGNQILQRYSVKKLDSDKWFSVVLADVVNRANVGMVQGGSRLGLTLKAGQRLASRATLSGRDFRATKRCRRMSSAWWTTPIPPPPIFWVMR